MTVSLLITTLRLGRLSSLAWAAGIGFYAAMIVALFPSMNNIEDLEGYMDSMPEQFMAIFGLEDTSQLFTGGLITFEGFLSTEYFTFWPILLAVYAVMAGGGLASRDLSVGRWTCCSPTRSSATGCCWPKWARMSPSLSA